MISPNKVRKIEPHVRNLHSYLTILFNLDIKLKTDGVYTGDFSHPEEVYQYRKDVKIGQGILWFPEIWNAPGHWILLYFKGHYGYIDSGINCIIEDNSVYFENQVIAGGYEVILKLNALETACLYTKMFEQTKTRFPSWETNYI